MSSPLWLALRGGALMFSGLALGGYLLLSGPPARASSAQAAQQDVTVLIAGRDVSYCAPYTPCEDQDSEQARRLANIDTLMLARLRAGVLEIVSIPRDTQVGEYREDISAASQKINSQYAQGGPERLLEAVSQVTGTPVEHYLIVQVASAERVIDALGGLTVTAERDISFTDNAAGMHLELSAGNHHLGGKDAVTFLRLRRGMGDDYGRMDNQKLALIQLSQKLQSAQGVRALPTILGELGKLESNLGATAQRMLSQPAPKLVFSTLPVREIEGSTNLIPEQEARAAEPIGLEELQEARVVVLDASGEPEIAQRVMGALEVLGFRPELREASPRQSSAISTMNRTREASALAELTGLPKLQGLRQPVSPHEVAIILGKDATQHLQGVMHLALPDYDSGDSHDSENR